MIENFWSIIDLLLLLRFALDKEANWVKSTFNMVEGVSDLIDSD